MSRPGGRRATVLAGATTLAVATALLTAPPASSAGAVTVTCTKTQDWGTGFGGSCTITNGTDAPVNGWTVRADLPSGTALTSVWDAKMSVSGNRYTYTDSGWNATLAAGAKTSFGFNGTGPGWFTGCTVNGAACDGSGGPGGP